jgi:hypothetical protein
MLIAVRKSSLLDHYLSQMKTDHTLSTYIFKNNFNIILASSGYKNYLLRFRGWSHSWYRHFGEEENIFFPAANPTPGYPARGPDIGKGRTNEHIIILPALATELPFCNCRRGN